MIYRGIDEAALGPRLGPFCVGLTEFQCRTCSPETNLYTVLQNSVTAIADGTQRTHLADSKQIYTPSKGIHKLEHGVAVLLNIAGMDFPQNLTELLQSLCPMEDYRSMAAVPWYADSSAATLPLSSLDISVINTEAEAVRQNMKKWDMQFQVPKLRMITAKEFNRLLKISTNKADAVQKVVGSLLAPFLKDSMHDSCRITIDRQGGRKFYGDWLLQLMPGAPFRLVQEGPLRSIYSLGQSSIEFAVSADRDRLETAAASMFAKYLRETAMHCFNSWWTARVPKLKPTAGYPKDARRFIRQIIESGQYPQDVDMLVRRL